MQSPAGGSQIKQPPFQHSRMYQTNGGRRCQIFSKPVCVLGKKPNSLFLTVANRYNKVVSVCVSLRFNEKNFVGLQDRDLCCATLGLVLGVDRGREKKHGHSFRGRKSEAIWGSPVPRMVFYFLSSC